MNWITAISLLSAVVALSSYFFGLIYALTQLKSYGTPAKWLISGLAFWLVPQVSGMLLNFFLASIFAAKDFAFYSMVMGLVQNCFHAVGVGCVVVAVFVERSAGSEMLLDSEVTPVNAPAINSDNPFASPRT